MPKSASTFCYQLAESMLRQAGHIRDDICKNFLPESLHVAFMVFDNEDIFKIVECIPNDKILIIKTHSKLSNSIDQLLKSGRIKATATFRDVRDAAVSLLDSGEKDRRLKKNRPFSEIWNIEQALDYFKKYEPILTPWLTHPCVLKLSYNLLAEKSMEAAIRIRDYLGIEVNVPNVMDKFSGNLSEKIWEFNVGKIGRYKKYMDEKQIQNSSIMFHDLNQLMDNLEN